MGGRGFPQTGWWSPGVRPVPAYRLGEEFAPEECACPSSVPTIVLKIGTVSPATSSSFSARLGSGQATEDPNQRTIRFVPKLICRTQMKSPGLGEEKAGALRDGRRHGSGGMPSV